MATLIKAVVNTGSSGAIGKQEPSIDQSPEVEITAGSVLNTALINTSSIIPSITNGLLCFVEGREGRKNLNIVGSAFEGVASVNVERVTVGGDTQNDLVGRHLSSSPCLDRTGRTALLISRWRATVLQRRVGTDI